MKILETNLKTLLGKHKTLSKLKIHAIHATHNKQTRHKHS